MPQQCAFPPEARYEKKSAPTEEAVGHGTRVTAGMTGEKLPPVLGRKTTTPIKLAIIAPRKNRKIEREET